MNTRQAVLEALIKMETQVSYSNLIFDDMLKNQRFTVQESSFCGQLFYGVIERRLTLDYIIGKYSKTPFKKLDLYIVEALRLGILQLLYLNSVPESAAVNETVSLVKASKYERLSGFVNAVLRSFIRDGLKISTDELWVKYSAPKELISFWKSTYGIDNTIGILEMSLKKTPVYLRVNTLLTNRLELIDMLEKEGVVAKIVDGYDNCLESEGRLSVNELKCFKQGYFHVQDKASQFAVSTLDARPNERILDLCAAPGGKSFTISQNTNNRGELISCDIHSNKLPIIKFGAKRLKITNITVLQNDATIYNSNLGIFDKVLCDVPCSGLGIIGKKPEIKYKSLDEIKGLPEIQKTILENSSRYVKSGGVLVYSTCTLNPKENEYVVDEFIKNNDGFSLIPIDNNGTKYDKYATIFPHINNSDGFFVAKMEKK